MALKIRDGGMVQRKSCYLALGINLDGDREVLGMSFQGTEVANFWALRPVYTAINPDEAMIAIEVFETNWPEHSIGRMWRESWQHVTRSRRSNPKSGA